MIGPTAPIRRSGWPCSPQPRAGSVGRGALAVPAAQRTRSGIRDWLELIRPFSFTASVVPVCVGAAVAWSGRRADVGAFVVAVVGVLLLQAGTNVINEVFDVANGVDTLQTPRASRVLVTGRLPSELAHHVGVLLLVSGAAAGALISAVFHLGWVPLAAGLLGAAAGYAYTAPPLQLKYRGLAVPAVALVMGPLMVLGAEAVETGGCTWAGLAASVPVTFLVAAILVGNDLRDLETDRDAGIRTEATILGRPRAWEAYLALLVGAYAFLAAAVGAGVLPWPALLALFSAPLAVRSIQGGARGREGLVHLDERSAQVHLLFGLLLTVGLGAWGLLA